MTKKLCGDIEVIKIITLVFTFAKITIEFRKTRQIERPNADNYLTKITKITQNVSQKSLSGSTYIVGKARFCTQK